MKKTKRIIPEKDNAVKRFIRNHPVLVNFLAICIAGILVVEGFLWFFDVFTHHGDTTKVPEVTNMSYIKAKKAIERAGLVAEIADSVYKDSIPPGVVLSVWPSEGSIVKPGRTVYLDITAFQTKMVTIKDPLVNVASRQAISYLNRINIKNVQIKPVPGEFSDLVVRALYNGKEIRTGMKIPVNGHVVLEVSTGHNPASEPPVHMSVEPGDEPVATGGDTDEMLHDSHNHPDIPADNPADDPDIFD